MRCKKTNKREFIGPAYKDYGQCSGHRTGGIFLGNQFRPTPLAPIISCERIPKMAGLEMKLVEVGHLRQNYPSCVMNPIFTLAQKSRMMLPKNITS